MLLTFMKCCACHKLARGAPSFCSEAALFMTAAKTSAREGSPAGFLAPKLLSAR